MKDVESLDLAELSEAVRRLRAVVPSTDDWTRDERDAVAEELEVVGLL